MLKFNAHLGFQFTELPFLDRLSAAAEAGFAAVEFPSPYEYDASVLADLLQASGLDYRTASMMLIQAMARCSG